MDQLTRIGTRLGRVGVDRIVAGLWLATAVLYALALGLLRVGAPAAGVAFRATLALLAVAALALGVTGVVALVRPERTVTGVAVGLLGAAFAVVHLSLTAGLARGVTGEAFLRVQPSLLVVGVVAAVLVLVGLPARVAARLDRAPRTPPVGYGALAGAVAFLAGYAVTYALTARTAVAVVRSANGFDRLVGDAAVPVSKAVAWLFYAAHGVRTRIGTGGPGARWSGGSAELWNAVGTEPGLGPLAIVPVVLLLFGGAAVALAAGATGRLDGAVAGATVAVGYAPLAFAGLVASALPVPGGLVAPALTGLAGVAVAYPVVVGALGGAAVGTLAAVARRRAGTGVGAPAQ